MATNQRLAIREYMIDHYRLGRRGTNDAAQSDKSTLSDDSEFGGPGGAEGIDVGSEVVARMDDTAGGGGTITIAEGRVSKKPTTSAGTVTFDPVLTALGETPDTAQNDTVFDILFRPLKVRRLHEAINKALEKIPEKLLIPVTLVTDGDMRKSADDDWSSIASVADEKLAASFPLGIRELQVTVDVANGYAQTATASTIQVQSSSSYFLEATARVLTKNTQTAKLEVFDVRNSADLSLDDDETTEEYPTVLWNPSVQMLSTTAEVRIRLGANESGSQVFWSNVQFRDNAARHFVIQDRMEIDRLGRLFATRDKDWRTRGDNMIEVAAEPHMLAAGLWEYRVAESVAGMALFYEEFSKRGTLTSDTARTTAPKEDVAAIAAEILLQPLRLDERWAPAWTLAASEASAVIAKYESQREYTNKAPKAVFLPAV